MNLFEAQQEKEYLIESIETDDEEMKSFLFSLGCYSGESIALLKRTKHSCFITIKDARYNIDKHLAQAIKIRQ